MESAGWKGKIGNAIHIDNKQGDFYARTLREFAKRGEAIVYRYLFNDVTVAMELCLLRGDTLVMLKTTYDETYSRYSPGMLMRQEIFRLAFSDPRIRRIEFLGRLQPWQSKWCHERRVIYHVNFYRFPWISRLHSVAHWVQGNWIGWRRKSSIAGPHQVGAD